MTTDKAMTEVKANKSGMVEVPSYMETQTEGNPLGLELATTYEQPSFTKIIQPLTKEKGEFKDGDLLIAPDNKLLVPLGEKFTFVPIFYFVEYCKQYNGPPVQGREWITERSFDINSDVAKRALSREESMNTVIENGEKLVYRQHERWIIILLDHNSMIGESPIIHTFQGGEAKYGATFRRMVKARKAPIFGCKYEAQVSLHTGRKGQWFGLDVFYPDDSDIFVGKDDYEKYSEMYKSAKKAQEEAGIIVDYENDEDSNTVDASSVSEKF